ncbi:MAG: serine/threonine protein phosphatase, partial [Butyricicoccaceae bacterium]
MGKLFKKYGHAVWLLYFPLYLLVFAYLERTNVRNLHRMTSFIDYQIPFCEWFIIPYLLWFAYIAVTVAYLFFCNVPEYHKLMRFLCTGMTVFLIFSAVYPNALDLRPSLTDNGCILTDLV